MIILIPNYPMNGSKKTLPKFTIDDNGKLQRVKFEIKETLLKPTNKKKYFINEFGYIDEYQVWLYDDKSVEVKNDSFNTDK